MVVSLPDGQEKGNKTFKSTKSEVAFTLKGVVDVKEQQLVKKEAELQHAAGFCRDTLAEIGKDRAVLEARLQELTPEADDGEEASEPLQKVQADLAQLEAQEKEFSTGLKVAETNLEEVQQALHKERVNQFRNGEETMRREAEVREAIAFVDGLGLGVLGAENVQEFFDLVSEKSGLADHAKINPAERAIDNQQKRLIMKMFARLVGSADGVASTNDR